MSLFGGGGGYPGVPPSAGGTLPPPGGVGTGTYKAQIDEIMGRYPGYQSVMNKDGSGLADPYKITAPGSTEKLRGEYFGTGMTGWGNAQVDRQRLDEANLRNVAAGDIMSARATGMTGMAQSGGLSSGARERMMGSSMENQANRMQNVSRAGMAKRADIGISDEATKASGRQFVSGQDMGIEQSNKAQAIQDLARQNGWSLDKARMEMQAIAAGNMADLMSRPQQFPNGVNPQDPTTWFNTPSEAGKSLYGYQRLYEGVGVPEYLRAGADPYGYTGGKVIDQGRDWGWYK